MKTTQAHTRARLCKLGLAVAGLVLAGLAAHPVSAQEIPSSLNSDKTLGELRGGIFIFQNRHIHDVVGNSPAFFGGLAVTVQQKPFVNRTNVAIDYAFESGNGNTAQIIPIFLEEEIYNQPTGGLHPFVTFGAGLVYEKVQDNTKTTPVNGTGATFGAMLGYGVDTASHIFVEARYTLVPELQTENLSGPEFMVGVRF